MPTLLTTALAGCTGQDDDASVTPPLDAKLVSFDSCDSALSSLKAAIMPYVGPYGVDPYGGGGEDLATGAESDEGAAAPQSKSAEDSAAGSGYSGTNVQEAGIDEPDIVKTDGTRILALYGDTLKIIDAADRSLVKEVAVTSKDEQTGAGFYAESMLLYGDKALVISGGGNVIYEDSGSSAKDVAEPYTPSVQLKVVDLAAGAVTESFAFEGMTIDARQIGGTVRLVVGSSPQFAMPEYREDVSDGRRILDNQKAVEDSTIENWLPRYSYESSDGSTAEGVVGCGAVQHAFAYSATSMLTVLSFDLNGPLGDGAPVTIVADGQTVYGSSSSLYIANDRRNFAGNGDDEGTELYRFDISAPGKPVYAASGQVPGYVLNQYSMSELDGRFRVATTSWSGGGEFATDGGGAESESSVYVFEQQGEKLVEVGHVDGLGKGEQIYSVRFVGTTAYVVTFRQTDPLYVVDLTDPASPTVAGELKITGYSAYLHPAGPGRLIGVGQEATEGGMTTGAQVSMFDVSNPASPSLLAAYEIPGASSAVEWDPHAFLYWEPLKMLVVPVSPGWSDDGRETTPGGAVVLTVGETALTEVGTIRHDASTDEYEYTGNTISRSLVIGDVLWTYSESGLMATQMSTMDELAFIEA